MKKNKGFYYRLIRATFARRTLLRFLQNEILSNIKMNVIEHLENYDTCMNETKRILKDNGKLIGVVPFLFPVHMVPDDFHRPTESSIHKALSNAGFKKIEIQPIGYGRWTAAASLCGQKIKFKPFAILIYFLAFLLDKIDKSDHKLTKGKFAFPIGYFFTAKPRSS